jgi:hypothetical protein
MVFEQILLVIMAGLALAIDKSDCAARARNRLAAHHEWCRTALLEKWPRHANRRTCTQLRQRLKSRLW